MRSLSFTLFLFVNLFGLASPGLAQKKIHGTIESLDADNGTIVIRSLEGGSYKSIPLSLFKEDLPISHPLGHPRKLRDLHPPQRVLLTLNESEDVIAIQDESDIQWGHISTIDLKRGELIFRLGSMGRTIAFKKIPLKINSQPGDWAELKDGQAINFHYSPDHRQIVEARAGKGIHVSNPYGRHHHRVGIVAGVDHAKRKIRFLTTSERVLAEDLEYDNWAVVRVVHPTVNLQELPIQELQPYCKVSLLQEMDTGRVSSVTAEVPMLNRRKVLHVDAEKRLLRLDVDGKAEEFRIADPVVIRTQRGTGRLSQLQENKLVSVGLSLDNKQVLYLNLLDVQ